MKVDGKWIPRDKTLGVQIKNKERIAMAEQKAIPFNVVCGDIGQKSRRIGKAFYKEDGKAPLSLTISLEALRKALSDKVVSEQPYKSNPTYPDEVLDGKNVIRIVGFRPTRKTTI